MGGGKEGEGEGKGERGREGGRTRGPPRMEFTYVSGVFNCTFSLPYVYIAAPGIYHVLGMIVCVCVCVCASWDNRIL